MNKDNWIIFGVIVSFSCGAVTLISAVYDQNPGRYYWMWSDSWFDLLRDLHNEYNNCSTLLLRTFGIFFFVCVAFFWWIPFVAPLIVASWILSKTINTSINLYDEYKRLKKEIENGEDDR